MGIFSWVRVLAFNVFRFKYDRSNEGDKLKVLHDWDRIKRSGSWALRRGISLLVYGLSVKLPGLNRIKAIEKSNSKICQEQLEYFETIIKLDLIAGIIPIFGILDEVRDKYGNEIDELARIYGVDVRRHIHIGNNKDPNRKRVWEPPLNKQTPNSWSFEYHYMRGNKKELQPGGLPIFHIDQPHFISFYIDYLFERMIRK